MQTQSISGLSFVDSELSRFLATLETSFVNQQKGAFIVTANPEIGYAAMNDHNYFNMLSSADFIVPDGIGVVIVSKMIRQPLTSRIAGFDIFTSLLKIANKKNKRIFLYGGKSHVIDNVVARIKDEYPNIEICGYSDGFVKDRKKIAQQISAANPDMVFVAIGYPNQEQFIYEYRHLFPQALCMGVGGSFDVFSGSVKRAPKFFIRFNIEWLYRLITDPKRVKRMLCIPVYMINAIKSERKNKAHYHAAIKDHSKNI